MILRHDVMSSKIISFILLVLWCRNVELVRVKVEQGWLEGQTLVPSIGRGEYHSFKGIPYAEPPVGKLRFRAPQPPRQWNGTRSATEHGSVCVQYKSLVSQNIIGSEDCLFLNVYSPNLHPETLMPVMFFIHGGGYITGSGNDDEFRADFLMEFGIVLVTINYRLDAFGFLAVDTEEVPGNAGLKDQIAAMHWVQKNIRNFGGDPDCVTLLGQSVGGSAVSLHIVSPAAKSLFHRAVAMSGTMFNDRSIEFEPRRRAFTLGRKLGLDTNDPYELIEFLQSMPPKRLIQVRPNFLLSDKVTYKVLLMSYFTPNIEKKFGNGHGQYLTESPTTFMCKHQINKVDLLLGHTAKEGLHNTELAETEILKYYPNYKELLVPHKISNFRSPKKVLELGDQVHNFYFGNQTISLETINQFVEFYSYLVTVFGVHSYIEKLPKLPSTRRFFYGFLLYSSRNVYSKAGAMRYGIKKATHKDDLPYLFDGSYYNQTVDVNSQEFKYIQLMCKLFTNFAKYGTPTPDNSLGLVWPEYDPDRTGVLIGETGNMSTYHISYSANTSLGFWRRLHSSVEIHL